MGRQPWIVYQNMRVSEAVTGTRAASLWTMFGIVVVVYVLVAWAMLGLLLRMKTRWRHEDAEQVRAGRTAGDIPAQRRAEREETVEP